MTCIGTAGHIDHGKSTLIAALTGIDPDRLPEEKARGMTIDLGFAWLKLPGGEEISVVDVPGHESFIKNMLAGVGGIDVALLVVAADEGVMPQTREHLAILDLLQIRHGVVALTKVDLVDEEWLRLVQEEVRRLLAGTTLAAAPIVPVSAQRGLGLAELLASLEQAVTAAPARQDRGRPRLPIDRVFTLTGFGTIVTGTLLDGSLQPGQEVSILPRGLRARIRSLQTHRRPLEKALPGRRVALNLVGVARDELARGDVVTLPDLLQPTDLVDVRLRLLADAPRALAHNTLLDFYCGARVVPATVRLLERESLAPGESALAQLRLRASVVVERHDRFILRLPSPSLTVGGGEVLDAHPRYHRRWRPEVVQALAIWEHATPEELLMALLEGTLRPAAGQQGWPVYEIAGLAAVSGLSLAETQQTLERLLTQGRVRRVGPYWFALAIWQALTGEALRLVREYHQQHPLRPGLSKEAWRRRLGLAARLAGEVCTALKVEGRLREASGGLLRLPDFAPRLTDEQRQQAERLLRLFRQQPYAPPTRAEAEALVGAELVSALIEQERLIKISDSILLLPEAYEEAVASIRSYLQQHPTLTVSQARDLLATTRKYVLPLLEYLDEQGITRRAGDERVLSSPPAPS